ncbi:hypothetical protein EIP91_000877 [Steccherinum ochraceum]|uniref:Uncharacterized protein n=1 Tax=Steccherinum ochraceum TaxID=92696 RepID=A0A4R0RXW6_9APHY|nr:hypothetical protein EIP91_000877 [Steccherinum ochraceum]
MRFASVFAGVLAVSLATVSALPLPSIPQESGLIARGDHPELLLRDYDLRIARDEPSELTSRDAVDELYARDLERRLGRAGAVRKTRKAANSIRKNNQFWYGP